MSTVTQSRPATAPLMGGVLLLAAVGLIVAGGYALSQLWRVGHAAFASDNRGIVWGLPIITYDFFLLSSTGLTMLASAWTVLGLQSFEPIARRATWLAIAALIGGVVALFMELGYPLRALWLIPTALQTDAPLFWKVWGILVYAIALAILAFGWLAGRAQRPSKAVSLIALLAAIYITFIAGGVYGWMAMRPFWYGGEISLAFIVESLLGGVSFIIIFTYLAHGWSSGRFDAGTRALFAGPLANLFTALIVAHALFVVARLVAGLWGNADGLEVWQHLWRSPLFQLELWVGIGVPLLIMLAPATRRAPAMQLIAALIAVVALFIARYHYVIGGQMVPLFKGSWAHGLLQYTPTTADIAVLLTAVFLANVVNALGERRLHLGAAA